jgi:hypothetical protein
MRGTSPRDRSRMKPKVIVRSSSLPDVVLESIDHRHLEFLRRLKNAHRHRFFHRDEISVAQQDEWFEGYRTRADDWMFVVRCQDRDVACIGYRAVADHLDLYNLLRAEVGARAACVTDAFHLFTSFLAQTSGKPLRGRVLVGNPALRWATSRGFAAVGQGVYDGLDYCLLEYDPARAVVHPFTVDTVAQP